MTDYREIRKERRVRYHENFAPCDKIPEEPSKEAYISTLLVLKQIREISDDMRITSLCDKILKARKDSSTGIQ